MKGFWKYLEAEALDGAKLGEDGRVVKSIVITQIEQDKVGAKDLMISRHVSGRALRRDELAGLLATQLAKVLDDA